LTISGNAPLKRLQFDPGSCVTTGRGGTADGDDEGDDDSVVAIAAVADELEVAVADGPEDGPAGVVARRFP